MVHPHLRLSLVAFSFVSLGLVGCVPYQTYQQCKMELEKAKDANADLVKRYNIAVQKLAGLKGGDGGEYGARVAQLLRENESLKQELEKRPAFNPTDIEKVTGAEGEEGGMRLGEALLFNEGSAELKSEANRVLDQLISLLRSQYPDEMVIVEGHTDNQPLVRTKGRWDTNMNLGYHRAQAVFKYFLDHGIPEKRVIVHSYSFNKPLDAADQSSEAVRTKNRRVVVRRGGTPI